MTTGEQSRALTRQRVRDSGGVWRRVRDLFPEIFSSAGSSGSSDSGGVSTHQSKGCWKISPKKFSGNALFRWWLWLLGGFATTGVRHSRWMGRQELTTWRNPNPNIPKLFYGSDTMLREKELCNLINLQRRKHTYLYSSVRAKKEIKLKSN